MLKSRLRIRFLPSPHHRDRRGRDVDLIVIHHIACPPGRFGTEDIAALFLGTLDTGKHPAYREVEGKELSAHFLVDRRGRVTQFVTTDQAAYHAGESRWRGRGGCNDFSVGIELVGDAAHDFTARQYAALGRLCRDLMRAHPRITPRRIVGHSQIAMPRGRKTDPGPRFDWARLHREIAALRADAVPVRRLRGPVAAHRPGSPASRHPSGSSSGRNGPGLLHDQGNGYPGLGAGVARRGGLRRADRREHDGGPQRQDPAARMGTKASRQEAAHLRPVRFKLFRPLLE